MSNFVTRWCAGYTEDEFTAGEELLNRKDGQPFDDEGEQRFAKFVQSIGVILEIQQSLGDH